MSRGMSFIRVTHLMFGCWSARRLRVSKSRLKHPFCRSTAQVFPLFGSGNGVFLRYRGLGMQLLKDTVHGTGKATDK
jgi:hypothetical protein